MADITNLMEDVNSDEVYYEEEQKESSITPGTYEARIVGLRRKVNTKTKSGVLCDIYWPRYKIADDSPNFKNRLVRDKGQFRFRSSENRNKNQYYKKFLDSLGISLSKTEIDGNIRFALPSISEDMIKGKKVLINVYKQEWNDSRGYNNKSVAKVIKSLDDE